MRFMRSKLIRSQVKPRTPSRVKRQSKPHARSQRPQCTHMTMCRLYGVYSCNMCLTVPRLGWVYRCQQDSTPSCAHSSFSNQDANVTVADGGSYFEMQAKIAESLGSSASVISQIRAGLYSFDQIETLLEQRRLVIDQVNKIERPSASSTPKSPRSPFFDAEVLADNILASAGLKAAPAVHQANVADLPMTPAGTPPNTPAGSTTGTPTWTPTIPKPIEGMRKEICYYQVCHSCRPCLQERIPMSVETVLSDETPAITDQEMEKLPVLDAAIVRRFGLRSSPHLPKLRSQISMDITMHQRDGYQDESSSTDWTPTTTSGSMSESDLQDDHDPFPCPGAAVCPAWTPTSGCAYDHGFDDGHRASNHGFAQGQAAPVITPGRPHSGIQHSMSSTPGCSSSAGSSISLPDPPTTPLTPGIPLPSTLSFALADQVGTPGKADTVCGVMSEDRKMNYGYHSLRMARKESNRSSFAGSEVEVEGGLALTEEAVGMGMPDILTEDQMGVSGS